MAEFWDALCTEDIVDALQNSFQLLAFRYVNKFNFIAL